MKVLLTGANGLVGSHVLDSLRARGIAVAVLLRPAGDTRFIAGHLAAVEQRRGALGDPGSLAAALAGVTHVIHSAGCVKALCRREYDAVNREGTRNLIEAVNRQGGRVERFVHLSSVAAGRPAGAGDAAREQDPPAPVSDYGRSKLAGEREVQGACLAEHVILRPAAVYGPRDVAFLPLFKAVKAHILPRFGSGRQALSLVFAGDLAEAVVRCLTHPAAAGKVYNVAAAGTVTTSGLAAEVAAAMGTWTLPLPLPPAGVLALCCLRDAVSRVTGRPAVLSRQKYAELRAEGWACDPARLAHDVGWTCPTGLRDGIGATLAWYRQQRWL